MDIRYAMHHDHLKSLDTAGIREHLLIDDLFENDKLKMVYSHIDRIIVGGVCPVNQKVAPQAPQQLGVDFFLQRREMGIINVGGKGTVTADGKDYGLDRKDGLYIGMGVREVSFASADTKDPAKFYFASAPAHAAYPTVPVSRAVAQQVNLGKLPEAFHAPVDSYAGRPVVFGVRPEDMAARDAAAGEGANWLTARAEVVETLGAETFVHLSCGPHSIVARMETPERPLTVGQMLVVELKMTRTHLFDKETSQTIV